MGQPLEDLAWQAVGLVLGLAVLAVHRRYVRRRLAGGDWRRFEARVRGDDPYPQRFTRVHLVVSDGTPHLVGRRGLRLSPGTVHVHHERPSTLRDRAGTTQVLVGTDAGGRLVEIAVRQPDAVLLREALAQTPVDRTLAPGLVDVDARRRRTADPDHPLQPPGVGERVAWAGAAFLLIGVAWLWTDGETVAASGRAQLALAAVVPLLVVALVVGARRRARSRLPGAGIGGPGSDLR